MYNQIEDILLNISIVIATVWIVKRFWGSFFEEKQNSILSVSLWIVYCIFQFFFGYHNGRLQIFATILNILLILSIAMVAYQSRGKEKYFLLATFYAGWSLIEVFVFSLINSFDIGESQQRDIIGLVLSNILMTLSVSSRPAASAGKIGTITKIIQIAKNSQYTFSLLPLFSS